MASCFNVHTTQTHRYLWQLIMTPLLLALKNDQVSTFNQEKRALNPVRIVVIEFLVYDMCGPGCVHVCSHIPELSEPLAI